MMVNPSKNPAISSRVRARPWAATLLRYTVSAAVAASSLSSWQAWQTTR